MAERSDDREANPPVLVVAFNRPHLLQRTLEGLREARPSRVYVSIDGPRSAVPSDELRIDAVARLVQEFQWECDVVTRRSPTNRGLGSGVVEAISWFFDHENHGVILEDDVAIAPSSLALAGRMLDTLRPDLGLGSISLFNAVPRSRLAEPHATYRRSRLPSSQYWGSWADRWSLLVPSIEDWRNSLGEHTLEAIGGRSFARRYAADLDEEVQQGFTAWEGLWIATHWMNHWDVATVNGNYSRHLGFGIEASNSTEQPSWYPTTADVWDGRFIKPKMDVVDVAADRWMVNQRYGLSPAKRAKRAVGQRLPGLREAWRRRSIQRID